MPRFTTRVELHGANGEAYADLHDAMEGQGFLRYIELDGGKKLPMPTAEYNYDGNATTDDVLNKAKTASFGIWEKEKVSILVTQSEGVRKFHNLIEPQR
jgi:hypothetical protein